MRRMLLVGSAVIFLLAVGWRQRVWAQDLLIDEYGRVYVEYEGQVLGEESEERGRDDRERPEAVRSEESDASGGDESVESEGADSSAPFPPAYGNAAELRFRQEVQNAAGVKRLKVKNGQLEVKIEPPEQGIEEDETGDEEEASSGAQTVERVRVRPRAEHQEIEIRGSGTGIEIRQQATRARTHFPLSIGPNNELIVTTSAGTKEVTVLPDQAVAQMLKAGFVSFLSGPGGAASGSAAVTPAPGGGDGATEAGEFAVAGSEPSQEVELSEEDGFLVYKVRGVKAAKLFGLVPVSADVTANVSAETGVVVSVNQPWYLSTFGFLFR